MAIYRMSVGIIGRSSGRSATAAAAYRAGQEIADARTGERHDYSRRQGVVHSEIIAPENTPDWMHDRAQLWNAVEAAEKRKDSRLSREVILALAHELDDDQRRELVQSFVRDAFVSRGMIADVAIHRPDAEGDNRNHHAHVMLTLRALTAEGFAEKTEREWNRKELVPHWREQWADYQNRTFDRLGLDVRVDHRRNEERGLDHAPEPKLGPHNAQLLRHGLTNAQIEAWKEARAEKAAAREADEVQRQIERFEAWAAARRNELALEKLDVTRDLEQRHELGRAELTEELNSVYGADRQKAEAALSAIRERQQKAQQAGLVGTVRRWAYQLSGRKAEDERTAEIERRHLDDIAQRRAEQTGQLEERQRVEKEALGQRFDRRQGGQERGVEVARERRAAAAWRPDRPQDASSGSSRTPPAGKEAEQKEKRSMPYETDRDGQKRYVDPTAPEPKPERPPERKPDHPGPSWEAQRADQTLPEADRSGLEAEPHLSPDAAERVARVRGLLEKDERERHRTRER